MKKIFLMVASATMVVACSSAKPGSSVDYQHEQWSQQQSTNQQPTRTLRQTIPSIELSEQPSDNLRAYGTARSMGNEKVAINEATRDARNELAQMLKVAVDGAAQDYMKNSTNDAKSTSGTISEAVFSQYVDELITNSPRIKTDIFDLSDGSIQVYVCVEMRVSKKELNESVDNILDREGFIENQYDREQFINKMSAGLEEYKKRNRAE